MKNKKGFTLAEALTTIMVIGIIAAILLPVVQKLKPDKDILFFKKGVNNFQNALSQVLRENRGVLTDETNSAFFCEKISEQVNTIGTINCGASSYSNPNFITNDGIRYWGLEAAFTNTTPIAGRDSKVIYIDRHLTPAEETKLANGTLRAGKTTTGLKIYVNEKGKTSIQADDTYEFGLIDVLSITK